MLGEPGKKTERLLEYLVQSCPASLDYRCKTGKTPLHLAFWGGRVNFAKILIKAGADQSVRDSSGDNIIHEALKAQPWADRLKPLLDLIDPDLREHLLTQRNNLHEAGSTPLHAWVVQYCRSERTPSVPVSQRSDTPKHCGYTTKEDGLPVLQLLLEYSQGAELEMLDGAGDTPLHAATMSSNVELVEALLAYRPRLLYRENAVGRTPAEVAHSRVLSQKFAAPESLTGHGWYSNDSMSSTLVERQPHEFAEDKKLAAQEGVNPWTRRVKPQRFGYNVEKNKRDMVKLRKISEMMDRVAAENPGERRLVSLGEANDVARRLGEKYNSARYFSIQARGEDDEKEEDDEEEEKKKQDFVGEVMSQNLCSSPWEPRRVERSEAVEVILEF